MADDIGAYRETLAALLKSAGTSEWTEDELDTAVWLALMDVSQRLPRRLSADVTMGVSGRRIDLATVADCLWVEEVWWPYDPDDVVPHLVPFEVREGWLTLFAIPEPQAGDVVHLLYAGRHAIAGLNEATLTTVPSDWRGVLVLGAAGYAAAAKAAAMTRQYSWPAGAAAAMRSWSEMMLSLFEARLGALRSPAVQAWVTWG